MNPHGIPAAGPCQACKNIVTRASWCAGCQAFHCWRCEGTHVAFAMKVPTHIRTGKFTL